MADVFISYKQDERHAVERLATALRAAGLSVWFDASVSAGEAFSDEIDREAREAYAVLVCWSPAARNSRWVKAEAMIGFDADKLVACRVAGPDDFVAPAPFNTAHAEDMRSWVHSGGYEHAGLRSILRRVGRLSGRRDLEAWGALSPDASLVELRSWLASYEGSPLSVTVESRLSALTEKLETPSRANERDPTHRESSGSSGSTSWTALVLALVALAAATTIMMVLILQRPGQISPSQSAAPSYEGVQLGSTRDQVFASHGPPQLVLGAPGSAGDGNQSVFAVGADAWPFPLREGEDVRGYLMPSGANIGDYDYWFYTAQRNDGHQVHVEFDPASDRVTSISCEIQDGYGRACAPFSGVGIGDTEQHVTTTLGQPSTVSVNGESRNLRYDLSGVNIRVAAGRVYGIGLSLPGPRIAPVVRDETAAQSTQPVDDVPHEVQESLSTEASSASVAAFALPQTCEGLSLLYQRDAVVTEVERTGALIVYTGRAVGGGGIYRYVAYQDLGLAVGDTFCGFQGEGGRMRIAGDEGAIR